MNQESCQEFAEEWARAWNRRDLDAVLQHFDADVVFSSPTAQAVVGTPVVVGRAALRSYWETALGQIDSLRFTVDRVLWDWQSRELAIIYTSEIGGRIKRVSENFTFNDEGRIVVAEVFHGIAESV